MQVVCRDGSSAYAEAVRRALPTTVQVADRWHLWNNLAEAVIKEVAAHSVCWGTTGPPPREGERAATTRERWRQVHDLLSGTAVPAHPGRPVPGPLRRRRAQDPAVPVLQLLDEITELGYTGSQNLLYRYITQGRVESDRPAISPKRLARSLLTHPDELHDHQRERIDAATGACAEMTGLAALISDFAALLTPNPGNGERLTVWIDQAQAEDLPHLHAFTRGLELDHAAVSAALTHPFHNGRTEGVNTKTKLIKRPMYGRAGFTHLRHRILLG